MEAASVSVAADLLGQQATFVYDFFEAAELEARATERYVLVALAAMYSYLAAKKVPLQFRRLAWYAPTFVAVFAFIRAFNLGWRQKKLLDYLTVMEKQLLSDQVSGWAQWYTKQVQPSFIVSAGAFYVLLILLTLFIAYRMTRVDGPAYTLIAEGEQQKVTGNKEEVRGREAEQGGAAPNEREITAARSRGSNLGLNLIRARPPGSGVLDFQAAKDAAECDREAAAGLVKGSAEPESR